MTRRKLIEMVRMAHSCNQVPPIAANFLRASAAIMLLFVAALGCAQTTSGKIMGTLTDQSGAVVAATEVTLVNLGTNDTRQVPTNASGLYQFVNVPPGTYRIKVQKQGFKTVTREPISLQVEGSVEIDLSLEVGSESESVTVTAGTPLIQAETASLGAVIDQRETNEIPLNGRNPMALAALVPGVVPQGQSMQNPTGTNIFAWGNYQIGGGMANQSVAFLDGSPMNAANGGLQALVPTQDSLQEFKVDTNNLSAEYGRFAGGAINFRTKSGTNELHGSAWEFLRNKVLNANTYFGNQAGLPNPPFTQNQYGFNIGGPIFFPHLYDGRNKTFFFVNWEGFGLRQGRGAAETVPTAAERTGDLSALGVPIYDPTTTCGASAGVQCGSGQQLYDRTAFPNATIPSYRLNSTALAYLSTFYPIPNAPGEGGQEYDLVSMPKHPAATIIRRWCTSIRMSRISNTSADATRIRPMTIYLSIRTVRVSVRTVAARTLAQIISYSTIPMLSIAPRPSTCSSPSCGFSMPDRLY